MLLMRCKKLLFQLVKFGIVGIIAAITDITLLVFLKEFLFLDVLVSSALSFSVSVILNYLLSMKFVFESKAENRLNEFVVFVILSIGGLLINQVIIWIGVKLISVYYLIVKIFAMIFVSVYNFVTRKFFLEKRKNTYEK